MSRIRSDYYAVLGLANFASMESIKEVHRALALTHHPDRGGDLKTMQLINEAYNFLKVNKEKYDILLKQHLAPTRMQTIHVRVYAGAYNTDSTTASSTGGWGFSYNFD